MRRIELPLPELGRGTQFLDAKAEELQERLRKAVPSASRPFVVVKAFKRRGSSGLAVEYDTGWSAAASRYSSRPKANPAPTIPR